MNSNGTTYQNGRFVNVDEVHNNTKNMTLSGFNQEGGMVTGNIENLTIESKQNTSTTKGSTKGGSLSISANGLPSGSANYSKTNGERRVVDNASTFIIGDGSNLKVGRLENTASAIGTTENGKLSIDEYVGHNLENVDKLKTAGGSVGVSTSGITSIGVNYSDKKQEGITKNTVIGNVEIEKSSGDEINRDLDTMTEITEDRDFKTNINVESQTINYIKNPEKFKEDLQKTKNEIYDIYHAVDSTVNLQGKEDRNISEQLGEVRQAKVIYNLIDSRLQEAKNQEDIAKAFEEASEDLGYKVKVIFTDPSNSPQLIGVDKKGNTYIKNGTAYVDKKTGIGYILVNTESAANSTKAGVIGTIAEEQSHIIGKKEGRQKVVPDGSEKGLESLGKPTNDYFKKQYSKNDKVIGIKSDGKDYSNVDFGENVGDASNPEDLKFKEYYRKDILSKDPNYKKIKFLVSMGTNMIPGVGEVKLGIEMFVGEDLLTEEKYDLIDRVQIGTSISKNISSRGINRLENQLSNSKFANNLNQGSQINTSFREQKTPISSTRSLADGKKYNVIKETSQGKVLINDGTPGGTTMAYQNRTTYPNGSMTISQKNLTTGETSFQGINPLGQRVFETSLIPYEANTLIGANSSSKMLVENGVVSQSVISRVSYQTGNNSLVLNSLVLYDKIPVPVVTNGSLVPPLTTNRALATVPLLTDGANKVVSKLPYNPVLKSPIKYPNLTYRGNLNTSTNINNYKEFPNNSSPINSNTVSLNQEFTTINGLDNTQFSNQAEVVKTVNVKNPLQDVSNIVDWKPVKKVDSSGEYLMNTINDNKTNYYLDYKVAGYYASDIRNMTLTEMRSVGTRGWNKTVRMLKGDAKDAYNFYRARAVEIMGSRNIEKKIPDGSPVEQVLTEGFDKNGYKINFRNFSTDGEGNYPTIDLYNTNGKSKYEIKFEE